MNLLAITADTWLVTGLGFGLVLVLLMVFVWLMQLLGWIMQPKAKAQPSAPAAAPAPEKAPVKAAANAETEAAIAMALHLYFNGVHDEEPTQVTVRTHKTQWNSKVFGLNQ